MEKKVISVNGKSYHFEKGKLFNASDPQTEIDPKAYAFTQARNGCFVLIIGTQAFLPENDFKEVPCRLILKNSKISYFRTDAEDLKNSCVFTISNGAIRVIGRGFKEIIPDEVYLISKHLYQVYNNDLHYMQNCDHVETWQDRIEVFDGEEMRWAKLTAYKKSSRGWKPVYHSVPTSNYKPKTN